MNAERFRAAIRARMELCGVPDLKTLAEHTSTSYKTFLYEWKHPELFRAATLKEIFDYLTMSAAERGELI